MKTIAIIGRPNVGKSTLFNRLIGKQKAIVDETAGTTRDWRDEVTSIMEQKFRLIDTAGLEKAETGKLQAAMLKSTESAAEQADILLFTVDAHIGITPIDQYFIRWLRKQDKPVILVANKCERKAASVDELFKLGFGEPIAISAEHNLGMIELYEKIDEVAGSAEPIDEVENENEKAPIQIAIIGRPNAGKSTIINKMIGQNRVITNEVAGTTRDSIHIDWNYKDHALRLVDTAGMRKKSHITEKLETVSVKDSLNAIKYAQIVMLVMDATEALERQDLRLAGHVIEEGRAIIIVVNKWDLVKDKKAFSEELDYLVRKQLGDITGVPIVKISALNDKNLDPLLDQALATYDIWNTRVPTGKLNQWIEYVLSHHPPPIAKGRRIKIRYITQTKTRPPTFMLSCSQPDNMPDSWLKYLINDLRRNFNLPGVPVRIVMPKKKNPYEKTTKTSKSHMPESKK